VRCGKPDALNAWNVMHIAQQVCEGVLPAAAAIICHSWQVSPVRINVLAKKRHLLVP
jgi:hypothetical protein